MKLIPLWDWAKPATIQLYLNFHKKLIAAGIDGTFPDKSDVFAFQNDTRWFLCENPTGPGRANDHTWADACGEITEQHAKAYNIGRNTVLAGITELYGEDAPVFKIGAVGMPNCRAVANVVSSGLDSSPIGHGCFLKITPNVTAEYQHARLVSALNRTSAVPKYLFLMMEDEKSDEPVETSCR